MTQIVFVEADGKRTNAEARPGMSVMQVAVAAGVAGIVAECGGAMACGTCHCRIDPNWADRLPDPSDDERDMLDFVIDPSETSRLSCQIKVTPVLDGLVIIVPSTQT